MLTATDNLFPLEMDTFDKIKNTTVGWEEFDLIFIDTVFNITNKGLKKIFGEINGYKFILTAESEELNAGDNIFPVEEFATTSINIGKYINPNPADLTPMRLLPVGPAGSDALIVIGDILAPGKDSVDYVMVLRELPERIATKNFPNPFNAETTIKYSIPDKYLFGVNVALYIYNSLGQRVTTLVSERQFPGTLNYTWDGLNAHGNQVGSGIYFYQLIIDKQATVKRMIMIK